MESNRRSLRSSFNSRSDAATRRRRLFLEQLENRSLLTVAGNGLSAAPDFYSLDEDTTLNVSAPGVLGNDAGTSAVLVASPANGAVSFSSDGSFSYTPLADWYGTDSFTYQALDGELISDEITVTLTVHDVPEPPPAPVAGDDSYTTDEDTPLTIGGAGVLDNDQGQSITAAVTSGPSNGSVTMNPDGSFTYTPSADFHGSDSFAYTVTDSANQTDDAQVTINVNAINDAPVAIDLGFSAYEDQQLMVYSSMGNGLLYGASDPDNDWNLTPQLVSQASNGYVDFSYYGSFIYTPAAEFSGTDTFTYQISDGNGGYSNVATVTIQVEAVNDAPVAVEDYFTLAEDDYTFSGNLLTNDSDIDSPTFSPTLASGVSNGNLIVQMDGSFVYNPYANFFGTDSFTYYVSDGLAQSNTVTVWLTITEVNDAPIGAPDSYSTNEDSGFWVSSSSGILGNDYDVETYNLSLTATLITAPTNGTFWLQSDGGFSYTPYQDFFGEDTFTYQASDGQLLSEITTVTITVHPINDTPVAADQSYTLDEDTPLTITDPNLGLLAGASDFDGDTLSVAIYNSPQFGQITWYDSSTGAFTYIPNENYFGNDYFTYLVSDGSASAFANVNLTINSVNDLPLAAPDFYTTNEDTEISGWLHYNDSDVENGSNLTASLVDPALHGYVSLSAEGNFTYTPNPDYYGEDTFTYSTSDGQADSELTTVTITVQPVNDAPVASDQYYSLDEDTPLIITDPALGLLAGASDPDGPAISVTLDTAPQFGQLTLDDGVTGIFTYIPNQNYFGNDVFTYLVSDGIESVFATAYLSINPVNDPSPTVVILGGSAAEGDPIEFYFELSGFSDEEVTIEFATADLTAESYSDYTPVAGTVVIPVGNLVSEPIIVTTYPDDEIEDYEYFIFAITGLTNAIADVAAREGVIRNDDFILPWVGVAASADSLSEDDSSGSVVFTFTRNEAAGDLIVYFGLDGSAELGADYELSAEESLVIPDGSLSATVTLTPVDDNFGEGNETAIVTINGGAYFVSGTGMYAAVIIEDDEEAPPFVPTVSLGEGSEDHHHEEPAVVEGNGLDANQVIFTINLDAPAATDVVVSYETQDGTAIAGEDYVAVSGQATIVAGQTSTTVAVPVIADSNHEANETFSLLLTAATNATLPADTAGQGIIENDDAPNAYSINIFTVPAFEDEGSLYVVIEIVPEVHVGGEVVVQVSTADYLTPPNGLAGATAGDDYVSQVVTLTFTHGVTAQEVFIPVIDDASGEFDEAFQLNASIVSGAPSASAQENATIRDPNLPPQFTNEEEEFEPAFQDSVEAGTEVIDLEGMDPDNDDYSFSLDDEDITRYAIDSLTGIITFAESVAVTQDYIVDEIPVRITDARGASSTKTVFVQIAAETILVIDPKTKVGNTVELSFTTTNRTATTVKFDTEEMNTKLQKQVKSFFGATEVAQTIYSWSDNAFVPDNNPEAYGISGYVIYKSATKVEITDIPGGKKYDYSGTKILAIPYAIKYKNNPLVRPMTIELENGKSVTFEGPPDTATHEKWHTDGFPNDRLRTRGFDKDERARRGWPGYKAGLEHAFEMVTKDLKTAAFRMRLRGANEAAAITQFDEVFDRRVIGARRLIGNFGFWHGADIVRGRLHQEENVPGSFDNKYDAYDSATGMPPPMP